MTIQISQYARNDLIEGYFFYEQSQEGLGDYFLASLYSDIEALRIYGGIHAKAHNAYHRALSKSFPYAIYYTVEKGKVHIQAVLDSRRNPAWIRRSLRERHK